MTPVICARCGGAVCDVDLSGTTPRWQRAFIGAERLFAAVAGEAPPRELTSLPACPKCGPLEVKAGALRKARQGGGRLRAHPIQHS